MPAPLFSGFLFLTTPAVELKNCQNPTHLLPVRSVRHLVSVIALKAVWKLETLQ